MLGWEKKNNRSQYLNCDLVVMQGHVLSKKKLKTVLTEIKVKSCCCLEKIILLLVYVLERTTVQTTNYKYLGSRCHCKCLFLKWLS